MAAFSFEFYGSPSIKVTPVMYGGVLKTQVLIESKDEIAASNWRETMLKALRAFPIPGSEGPPPPTEMQRLDRVVESLRLRVEKLEFDRSGA